MDDNSKKTINSNVSEKTKVVRTINESMLEGSKKKTINKNTQEYVDKLVETRKRNFKIIVTIIVVLFILIILFNWICVKSIIK